MLLESIEVFFKNTTYTGMCPNSKIFFLLFAVPNNVEDETAGCIHFADQFTNRYGECHPEFFPGSLDEAVKEACLKPAKDVSEMLFPDYCYVFEML